MHHLLLQYYSNTLTVVVLLENSPFSSHQHILESNTDLFHVLMAVLF